MQSSNTILLIRPSNFTFNKETSSSNSFQVPLNESEQKLKDLALQEFDNFAATLKEGGVNILVFDDTEDPQKPDAVFPNNWVSFHSDGTVILYPMCAANRRLERRADIIESMKRHFIIKDVLDLSYYENENKFLEGTGSIVFDHVNKIAYACLSPRTDRELFIKVCKHLKYEPVHFHSYDQHGNDIYHTNVMMCVAERFAVICLESITDAEEREMIVDSLESTGHQVIDISYGQMKQFAGNMLAVKTEKNKTILGMSRSAFDSLSAYQKSEIEKYCALVPLQIKTIETIGGGSARCMMAEVFLQPVPEG